MCVCVEFMKLIFFATSDHEDESLSDESYLINFESYKISTNEHNWKLIDGAQMNRNERREEKKTLISPAANNTVLYAFFSLANTFQAGRKRKSQNEQIHIRRKKNNCIFNLTTNSSRIPICLIISYSKKKMGASEYKTRFIID